MHGARGRNWIAVDPFYRSVTTKRSNGILGLCMLARIHFLLTWDYELPGLPSSLKKNSTCKYLSIQYVQVHYVALPRVRQIRTVHYCDANRFMEDALLVHCEDRTHDAQFVHIILLRRYRKPKVWSNSIPCFPRKFSLPSFFLSPSVQGNQKSWYATHWLHVLPFELCS